MMGPLGRPEAGEARVVVVLNSQVGSQHVIGMRYTYAPLTEQTQNPDQTITSE